MNSTTARPATVIASLLAVMCGAMIVVITSSLGDTARYALGAALLIGIATGAYKLSQALKENRTR
ncbi:hypothetical protein [Streptomyces sp. Rer75]|uniref:hypothetical protein n=1 Tax=Streptomyces sp. Rer75 TaxID=2750011 RepID=UPI0015D06A27|nr:hypothetical protein [Streptomyces sp. Rer75]QLH20560.1 hypothetical protein HYQ63_07825 [Streptomyces sp. Rer75]